MLTRLKRDIEKHYPGTKIAVTEYNFGGGDHISGAIAQADVLGIFGREGVFAACWWDENKGDRFINAAFDLFLNYDGNNSRFGDTSIHARTDDVEATSVYASVDSRDRSRMTVVLINKTDRAHRRPVHRARGAVHSMRDIPTHRRARGDQVAWETTLRGNPV